MNLKQVAEVMQDKEVIEVMLAARPEQVTLRTMAGTNERLRRLSGLGFGSTKTECGHLCLQMGMLALERSLRHEE